MLRLLLLSTCKPGLDHLHASTLDLRLISHERLMTSRIQSYCFVLLVVVEFLAWSLTRRHALPEKSLPVRMGTLYLQVRC